MNAVRENEEMSYDVATAGVAQNGAALWADNDNSADLVQTQPQNNGVDDFGADIAMDIFSFGLTSASAVTTGSTTGFSGSMLIAKEGIEAAANVRSEMGAPKQSNNQFAVDVLSPSSSYGPATQTMAMEAETAKLKQNRSGFVTSSKIKPSGM